MKKKCPICEDEVDSTLFDYHLSTEKHLLDQIKERYPAWSGNEKKILWFYKTFIHGSGVKND